MAKPLTAYDRKRLARRDEHWPDAKGRVYYRKDEAGFCTVPRTLVMIATLIRHLSKNDASRVYLDLWMRQRDDGFVEAEDPLEMAASAALTGTRAQKSWREKIDVLAKLGFIEVRGKGAQRYRFILLLHPHDIVQKIRHETPEKIPDDWWSYFEHRVQEIGATLRWKPEKKPVKRLLSLDDDDDDGLPF